MAFSSFNLSQSLPRGGGGGLEGGGYSGSQVTGTIEWGEKINPPQYPEGFKQNPPKIVDQN